MLTRFFNFIGVLVLATSFINAQLFISEAAEGSSNNKYLEIYNAGTESVDLSGYAYPSVSNAPSVDGEYEFWNAFDDGASVAPGDVYVVCHGSSDAAILAECDETHQYLSNGDDGYCLVEGTEDDYAILDCIGDWYGDPGSGWDVCGVSAATKDHTIVRLPGVSSGNAGDWAASAGTSTDDCEWVVLDQNDWSNLGSHAYGSVTCDDEAACNTGADELCTYPADNYDCDGNCTADLDCNDECGGSAVVDDCGVCGGNGSSCAVAQNLFISEIAEGSSNNKYLEIYNASGADVDLGPYSLSSCSNGCNTWDEWDYPNNVTFAAGTVLAAGDVYVVCHGSADDAIAAECDQTFTYLSNGDDVFGLTFGDDILDVVGTMQDDPGSGWEVCGEANATKDHTLVRKADVAAGTADWAASAGTNGDDCQWVVLDQNDWTYLGSHPHDISLDVLGCTDAAACNYNADATSDDGSCTFAAENFDCDGNCTADIDCAGTCGGDAIVDCNGECGGDAAVDVCGICDGDGTWCLSGSVSLGAATSSSLEVLYDSPLNIGGFQFSISGADVTGASGGVAADSGFEVSTGGGIVLGFSFSGSVIPAGSGVLTNLGIDYDGLSSDLTACISGVVLSDDDGDQFSAVGANCVDLPCTDADGDAVCDWNDDCVGFYDCNGSCADLSYLSWVGDGWCDATGYADGTPGFGLNFLCEEFGFDGGDCDSYLDCADVYFGDAALDCAGTCDGSATTDACGVCDDDASNDNYCAEVGCPDGYVLDCSGEAECAPASWIGDGWCDGEDQAFGYDLSCYDNDGGDCAVTPVIGDSCADGAGVYDCALNCVSAGTASSWNGDGFCDDGSWGLDLNCAEFNFDSGDCGRSNDAVADAKVLTKDQPIYPTKSHNSRLDTVCLSYEGPDVDCAGDCFGDAVVDECGVCNGGGIADGECDCDGNVLDDCDVCNGNGTSCLEHIISLGITTENSLEVLYSSSEDFAGFQFTLSGVNVNGASGGAAEDAGFTVTTGDAVVLGYSLNNSVVSAGTGVLTVLDVDVVDFEACISDVVVSDDDAMQIDFNAGGCVDLPVPCDDADADGICDDVDDCVGEYDECGVCNGDGIADDACDCDGNVEDCAGDCGGDAVEDCAGECNGTAVADCAGVCNGDAVEDCGGTCNGTADLDVCGNCEGLVTDSAECLEFVFKTIEGSNEQILVKSSGSLTPFAS